MSARCSCAAARDFFVQNLSPDTTLLSKSIGMRPRPLMLRQVVHRSQQQMAMPTGPLVVLSPAFVAPYETTFFLREKVGYWLPRNTLGQPWLCLQKLFGSERPDKPPEYLPNEQCKDFVSCADLQHKGLI